MDLHDRAVKKRLKSDVNRISLAVILNTLLLFIIMLMSMILRSVIAVVNAGIADAEKVLDDPGFWDHMMKSGMEYLLFSILGVFLVWLITRKKFRTGRFLVRTGEWISIHFSNALLCLWGFSYPFHCLVVRWNMD